MQSFYDIKIQEEQGKKYIYDGIRKKYVSLTPEELVRQHTLKFLIEDCNYPKTAINVEKKLTLKEKTLRYDIMVFKGTEPWLLVECKSPDHQLSVDVFYQSTTYHYFTQVKFIVLTNGSNMACFDVLNQKWLSDMPTWDTEI